MSLKNPKECFCLQQQQTFFVLNELTPSTCENGSEPLTFHHETFSRFRFVIINKDKKAKIKINDTLIRRELLNPEYLLI